MNVHWLKGSIIAGIESMGIIEQIDTDRQDARLDACRKARLRVVRREGRLHMPAGSRKVATALGLTPDTWLWKLSVRC